VRAVLANTARLVTLGLAFFAIGLAPAGARPLDLSGIHTIGVISAVGHRATLQKVGFMAFGNLLEEIDSSDWGIDDKIAAMVTDALQGRIAVRRIAADPVAFSTQETSWYNESQVPVEDLVSKLTDREGIDAYLVCYPFPVQDPINPTNQWFRGLGLYRRGWLGPTFDLFAFYRCALIDARTNKELSGGKGMLGDSNFFQHPWPYADVDPAIWADHAPDLTATQRDAIKAGVMDLVEKSLPWALSDAGLVPAPSAK
jgi:hypothetical protein